MRFTDNPLNDLFTAPVKAGDEAQARAERENLLLEERLSEGRRDGYLPWVAHAGHWGEWREGHGHYVADQVRRRHPPSAAFASGEPSLRDRVENQYIIRVERLDRFLKAFNREEPTRAMRPVDIEEINRWIAVAEEERGTERDGNQSPPRRGTGLADLGRLMGGPSGGVSSDEARGLERLTRYFNRYRRKRTRPAFIAFDAEFQDLPAREDWLTYFCMRCGLTFEGRTPTLALMRYTVGEVIEQWRAYPESSAGVFAAPTVLDHPFNPVYCPAPADCDRGYAMDLTITGEYPPAAELIHAPVDYKPEHWVRVGRIEWEPVGPGRISPLRRRHLEALRVLGGRDDYGRGV